MNMAHAPRQMLTGLLKSAGKDKIPSAKILWQGYTMKTLIYAVFFSLVLLCSFSFAQNQKQEVIVDTPKGKVAGLAKDGVDTFLGLPIGLPPYEGNRRLALPEPAPAWQGVLKCFKQADLPLQPDRITTGSKDTTAKTGYKGGGDCLAVNIWAPAGRRENLPVLAYIPGGGSVRCDTGSIDGSAFAKDGIIVVAIPYRPNIDGFLKIAGVPANLAIRDMIFGLEWIHNNIASFGGNPENVTVMGQSAGATHIGSLLASPLAKGLFKKAILMSGSHLAQWTPAQADKVSEELGAFYGEAITRDNIAQMPFEKLMTFPKLAAQKLGDKDWLKFTNGNATLFKPYIDGTVLPKRPVDMAADGASKDIDILIGSTANEWNAYIVPNGVIDKIKPEEVEEIVAAIGANPDVPNQYRKNGRGNADGEVFSAIESDIIFRMPTNRMLESLAKGGNKIWAYSFAEKSPSFNGKMGAAHAADLPYAFNTLNQINNSKRVRDLVGETPSQELAEKMHTAWVNFIKNGDPGWNQYDPQKRNTMIISSEEWGEKNDPWHNERELINLP